MTIRDAAQSDFEQILRLNAGSVHFLSSLRADVACAFGIDPPNKTSRRFHERYGFMGAGTHSVVGGMKRVSLRAVALQLWRCRVILPSIGHPG